MPPGGTVRLTGSGTATHVQLQVSDTGPGIPPAHVRQIFEPLYTTKPGGTGLGLYIVQQIVTAHAGQITVESREGRDTTFTLTLPRAAALHEAAEEQDPAQLARVQQLAEAQLAWIDAHAPAYEHSTASAQARGHTSIFTLLAQQAHAKIQLLQLAPQEESPP